MIDVISMLLMSGLFFSLRVSGNTGSFPKPLSPKEEEEQLRRLGEGDPKAREVLIEHNLRLVAHIVKKYFIQTDEQDDLVSIGTIGLIKAINTYKPDRNIKLATYASRCIENEILMYLRKAKKRSNELSMSESLDADPEGGNLSLMDVIYTEDDVAEALDNQEACRKLRRCLPRCLTPRELEIINLRYGLTGAAPCTQREVAQKCGISRSYVSRIEKKALKKLEEALMQQEQ